MTVYAEKIRGAPTGAWVVELIIPGTGGKRYKTHAPTEAAARELNAKLKKKGLPRQTKDTPPRQPRRPRVRSPGSELSLVDLKQQCLATQFLGRNKVYLSDMSTYMGRFLDWLTSVCKKEPAQLTQADMETWMAYCRENFGSSPSSVNQHITAARHFLGYLVKAGRLEEVPKAKRLSYKGVKMRRPLANAAEQQAFVTALRTVGYPQVADMLIASIGTGLRKGSLLSLRPEWLKEDSPGEWTLYLPRTKTTARVAKAVTAEMAAHLRGCLPFRVSDDNIKRSFRKAQALLGWSHDNDMHVTFHGAGRHTFGTNLTARGVPSRTLQALMDHSSIETTQGYAHVVGTMGREALGTMSLSHLLLPTTASKEDDPQ